MSGTNDRMQSDYLWLRHAPVDEGLKTRNHGLYFIYDRVPNSVERLEMIYRSIGKQYDWELQKFRLGKKGVDKGNKRRFLKNALRFVKNPLGYVYWKTRGLNPNFPAKFLVCGIILTWVSQMFEWKQYSRTIEASDELLLCYGKNVEGSLNRMKGYHNVKYMRGPNFFDGYVRVPLQGDEVVINETWRQNFRKEIQLLNDHNVVF